MLEIKHLHVYYQNLHALHDVSMEVEEGEIVALIGANGSGKSTVLRAVSGLVRPTKGAIAYLGENIESIRTEERESLIIGLIFVGQENCRGTETLQFKYDSFLEIDQAEQFIRRKFLFLW